MKIDKLQLKLALYRKNIKLLLGLKNFPADFLSAEHQWKPLLNTNYLDLQNKMAFNLKLDL
jgi:hypothetical protein